MYDIAGMDSYYMRYKAMVTSMHCIDPYGHRYLDIRHSLRMHNKKPNIPAGKLYRRNKIHN